MVAYAESLLKLEILHACKKEAGTFYMAGYTCKETDHDFALILLAAMALIPDDDDEELIEKAKANRKTRLQTEKVAEKEYAKTGGFADSEVVAVQVKILPTL